MRILGRLDAGPVEFIPPDGVRPGQVGTLARRAREPLDVTATIVDLAVRGWLTITGVGRQATTNSTATRQGGQGHAAPLRDVAHERAVQGRSPSVKLSDLKYKFRAELAQDPDALYDDIVTQGWYRIRPDRTRHASGRRSDVLGVVRSAIGLTVLVALDRRRSGSSRSRSWSPGIALLVARGPHAGAHRQGHRDAARGARLPSLVRRRRGRTPRARFAEQHDIFSQYLPYAIVFGCTKKWAKAFEGLDAERLGATSWYSRRDRASTRCVLASSMDHFGTVATGTMYASMPSSSSSSGFCGFAGGSPAAVAAAAAAAAGSAIELAVLPTRAATLRASATRVAGGKKPPAVSAETLTSLRPRCASNNSVYSVICFGAVTGIVIARMSRGRRP